MPDSWTSVESGSEDPRENKRERERSGEDHLTDYHSMMKRDRLDAKSKQEYDVGRKSEAEERSGGQPLSSSALLDAARAAGLEIPASTADPTSSISALLAAAQATGGLPPAVSSASSKTTPPTTATTAGSAANQGLDLSNPTAAMVNVNVSSTLSLDFT